MKESYTLKLEGKEWKNVLKETFDKKKKDIKMDGFRKGQVPYDIYVKKAGIESLYMDAVDSAVEVLYSKLISDEKTIKPVATPKIDIKNINENELEIEFTLVGMPEVKLGKYKNLGIKKEEVKVTDHDIEHEIEHLKEHFVDFKLKDGKILNGDTAVIDFEGFKDGVAFEGGKGEDYPLVIGSNSFIPGFEEGLIGLSKGDKKDLTLKFPENYGSEELAGKEVVFKVEIKEVKEKILPELNEEFFKDLGIAEVNSLDTLKEYIKKGLTTNKEREINDKYLFECLDKVKESSKFEIPEEMIEDEIEYMVKDFSDRLSMQGLDINTYLQYTGSDMNKFKDSLKGEAEKKIGYRLIINKIIETEKLDASVEELNTLLEEESKKYNMTKEDLLKEIGSLEIYKSDVLAKKAMEIVTGEVQI